MLLKNWFASMSSKRIADALPTWLAVRRDPRLWALRRRSVALGAAIGALASVIPLPIQIPIAVLSAVWLRAHVAAAAAATLLSNPLTIVPMWVAAWQIGAAIAPAPDDVPASQWALSFGEGLPTLADLFDAIGVIGPPLLIGLPVLGAALGLTTYLVVILAWRFTVVSRRSRRHTAGATL